MPEAVVTFKRGPHFAKTLHKGPTQAGEIKQLMEIDSEKALKCGQNHASDTCSSDRYVMVCYLLLSRMESNESALDEVTHLLMIRRVFVANDLNDDRILLNVFKVELAKK